MPTTEARPVRAVAGLSTRLIRRGTLAMAGSLAGYMVLEALAFNSTYPDAASRASLTLWGEDPGLRMLAGQATAVETLGGFIVWDASLYMALVLSAWSLATASRIVRGDEALGRIDALLAGPITPARALRTQSAVLLAACAIVGASVGGGLAVVGAQLEGSLLYGAGLTTYLWVLVALVAFTAQLLDTRAATLAATGGMFVVAILLRMASNSDDSRSWLGWLTPTAWPDHVLAFGENRWAPLLIPLGVTSVLLIAAEQLRTRRDAGAAVLRPRDRHRSRMWGLGNARAFAWRSNLPVLGAWTVGVTVAGGVVGALLPTMSEHLAKDPSFQQILAAMGVNVADLVGGFINLWSTILGLVIAVYCGFRMGATRTEEATTRADLLLTRPVRRWQWLGGHVLALVASVLVLCTMSGIAMWAAGVATNAEMAATDPFAAMLNMLPMVAVFAGIAVATFGLAPRLTAPFTASAAGVTFVLEMVGPALHWPDWIVGISPFHHLAAVPVDPLNVGPALAMVAIGIALTIAGVGAFQRRDLIGA